MTAKSEITRDGIGIFETELQKSKNGIYYAKNIPLTCTKIRAFACFDNVLPAEYKLPVIKIPGEITIDPQFNNWLENCAFFYHSQHKELSRKVVVKMLYDAVEYKESQATAMSDFPAIISALKTPETLNAYLLERKFFHAQLPDSVSLSYAYRMPNRMALLSDGELVKADVMRIANEKSEQFGNYEIRRIGSGVSLADVNIVSNATKVDIPDENCEHCGKSFSTSDLLDDNVIYINDRIFHSSCYMRELQNRISQKEEFVKRLAGKWYEMGTIRVDPAVLNAEVEISSVQCITKRGKLRIDFSEGKYEFRLTDDYRIPTMSWLYRLNPFKYAIHYMNDDFSVVSMTESEERALAEYKENSGVSYYSERELTFCQIADESIASSILQYLIL